MFMNWLLHPVVLEGERVKLVPLDPGHFAELLKIGAQEKIWEFISINGAEEQILLAHLRSAVLKRATGEQYAFTVIDKVSNKIIGSTLFHNIYPVHRKVEIGWTWYDPAYWRTGYNVECKLLLLTYAFETLKTVRVQLQTDANNLRSRTAIEGIGAVMEGMMRKERIRANGEFRTTVMYSIIDDEWPAVKQLLKNRLQKHQ